MYNGEERISGAEISQENQFVEWTYYDFIPDQAKNDFVEQGLSQLLSQFEKKMDGYVKESKSFNSLNNDLSGWLIEVNDKEKKNTCFIYAAGIVNSEHVKIYCGLTKKPKKNKDIPDFISQIIQLK